MKKLIYIFMLIVFPIINSSAQCREDEMHSLIEQWENRDGNQFIEIGLSLSKFLIKCDSVFLSQMSDNPKTFSSWLDKLESSSFTVYEAGNDKVEQELYSAYYNKLKEMMIISARKWISDINFSDIAQKLNSKLMEIEIIFID